MCVVRITAEMTGTVFQVLVVVGQDVAAMQDVAILESMKMEIPVQAPSKGTVAKLLVGPGDFVNEGDVLMELA